MSECLLMRHVLLLLCVRACVRACVQIMLNTSREIGDLSDVLQSLYDDIFVEYVVKSPQYTPGQPFQ